jgi:Protein of unknown function (DUF3435)
LALVDHAFRAREIQSAEDIFRIEVPDNRNGLELKWKPEILDIPIFRRAESTPEGIKISANQALTYDAFNQYLQRLGRNVGFKSTLTPYCIRRGTANAVAGKFLCF